MLHYVGKVRDGEDAIGSTQGACAPQKRKRREDLLLPALISLGAYLTLVCRVVERAAVSCDVGFLTLRRHHFDATRDAPLRIGSREADMIYAAVTVARTFGTQEDGVAIFDCINCRVAIAETISRLVLSNAVDCNGCIILRVHHAQDVYPDHSMIRRPEHWHVCARIYERRRRNALRTAHATAMLDQISFCPLFQKKIH